MNLSLKTEFREWQQCHSRFIPGLLQSSGQQLNSPRLIPSWDKFSTLTWRHRCGVTSICDDAGRCTPFLSIPTFTDKTKTKNERSLQCFCFVFIRVQELCESRGGRPGLSVLMSLTVSVDVKQHWTVHRHWSQFVPNMSTDIRGHEALHHHTMFWRQCSGRLKNKQTNKTKQKPRRRWSNVTTHNPTTVEHNSNPHIQYSNNCDSSQSMLLLMMMTGQSPSILVLKLHSPNLCYPSWSPCTSQTMLKITVLIQTATMDARSQTLGIGTQFLSVLTPSDHLHPLISLISSICNLLLAFFLGSSADRYLRKLTI